MAKFVGRWAWSEFNFGYHGNGSGFLIKWNIATLGVTWLFLKVDVWLFWNSFWQLRSGSRKRFLDRPFLSHAKDARLQNHDCHQQYLLCGNSLWLGFANFVAISIVYLLLLYFMQIFEEIILRRFLIDPTTTRSLYFTRIFYSENIKFLVTKPAANFYLVIFGYNRNFKIAEINLPLNTFMLLIS